MGDGYSVRDAMIPQNRLRWGENRLGKALMEARTFLRDQEE